MQALSVALFVLAYLLAVVDGTMADKGTYLSAPGRTGLRRYVSQHPWIIAGAACGIAGIVVDLLS
jgi:hypothetical protein